MQTKLAVISIIVEDEESVEKLNGILHEYGNVIIGRMGLPYKKCDVNIISVAVDAPEEEIKTLAEKIGTLNGVNSMVAYSNVSSK